MERKKTGEVAGKTPGTLFCVASDRTRIVEIEPLSYVAGISSFKNADGPDMMLVREYRMPDGTLSAGADTGAGTDYTPVMQSPAYWATYENVVADRRSELAPLLFRGFRGSVMEVIGRMTGFDIRYNIVDGISRWGDLIAFMSVWRWDLNRPVRCEVALRYDDLSYVYVPWASRPWSISVSGDGARGQEGRNAAACVVAFNSGLRRFTLEGVAPAAGEGCIWDGRGTVTCYRSEADCRAGNRILVERMPGRGA